MFERTLWQVNQELHGELLEVAKAQRLIKKPKAERQQAKDSLVVNVGDLLIAFGSRLKARHESATQ